MERSIDEAKDWVPGNSGPCYHGPRSPTYFDYGGVSADGHNELAFLVDVSVSLEASHNLNIALYYGHGYGRQVIEANYPSRDLDYGFVEFFLSF